jgi:excisionase family DNA binding protein
MKRQIIAINGKPYIVMSGMVRTGGEWPVGTCKIHLLKHTIAFYFDLPEAPFRLDDIVALERDVGCILADGRRVKIRGGKPLVTKISTAMALLHFLELQREEGEGVAMLTIQEAAKYARVTDRTIRSWCGDELLPGIIGKGRLTRIPATSLDVFKKKPAPPVAPKKKASSRKR